MLRETAIGRILVERRHTALLLAITALFVVRPFLGDTGAAAVGFSIALLTVLLFALLTIHVDDLVGEHDVFLSQRRRWCRFGWMLAVPAVLERLGMVYAPGPRVIEA